MTEPTRAEALRLLGLADPVDDARIDSVIRSEFRTWSSRTNAPDFEARTEAQRRLQELDRAEATLLGARKDRNSAPMSPAPQAPAPDSSKPAWYSNPAPPPPAAWQGATPQVQITSSNARWSMILGIFSVTCCGLFAGVGALYLGYRARNEINLSGGTIQGSGLATTGIVLGWISIGLSALLFIASAGGG